MEKKQMVCIVSAWEHVRRWDRLMDAIFGRQVIDPQAGEIVTVVDEDETCYDLEGYDESYAKEGFVPLNNQFKEIELAKILEEETKLVSSN